MFGGAPVDALMIQLNRKISKTEIDGAPEYGKQREICPELSCLGQKRFSTLFEPAEKRRMVQMSPSSEQTPPFEQIPKNQSKQATPHRKGGRVSLVGAGPGNVGLLTLRGAELLGRCDVVLYDGLSNVELLTHAPTAEHVCVGKHGKTRLWTQPEIIDEMLRHALDGKHVVRLKGGDPAIFARTSEEVDAIRTAGISFEVVPGITAALAAGSYTGIPITHRGLASAVALVTGHEEPGKAESDLDWEALAKFPGTLVVYMGVTTAKTWTAQLIQGGKSADTPAAIIRRCSLPDQQVVHCSLGEVADRLSPASRIRPPVITIVGEVARLAESMTWFDQRPLFGQTVLVTRPVHQGDDLSNRLRDLGANVLVQPAIEIAPLDDFTAMDKSIASLGSYDTLVFCSRNGVTSFLDRVLQMGKDMRCLGHLCLAAVGSQTADALKEYRLVADLIPADHCGDSLAKDLDRGEAKRRCLVVRASRGSDEWIGELVARGHDIDQVIAYQNRDTARFDDTIVQLAVDQHIDWVTLTSSASVRSVYRVMGQQMKQMRIATLGPATTRTVEELGLCVDVQANPSTIESLVAAIASHDSAVSMTPPTTKDETS